MRHKFIHLIADYGVGDPAFAEVTQKLKNLSPEIEIYPTSVPDFSTLACGFWTAQYALVNPLPNLLIYTNVDPRKDNKEARAGNEGHKLCLGQLKNGVKVVGVHNTYCFSFIKSELVDFRLINVANKGSQFRSRDFYPEAVIGIMQSEEKFLGEKLDIGTIVDVPDHRIAWIDGYGNIKTTLRASKVEFKSGAPLEIHLNEQKRTAYFSDGTFQVREGELAFAPGSSGGGDKFMEIFLRGLSAWKEFGKPHLESEFSIYPLSNND